MESSLIIPLLAGLDARQRESCVSAGAMVRRQQACSRQAFGQWTGNLVIATLNRQVILDLPDLPITSISMKVIGQIQHIETIADGSGIAGVGHPKSTAW